MAKCLCVLVRLCRRSMHMKPMALPCPPSRSLDVTPSRSGMQLRSKLGGKQSDGSDTSKWDDSSFEASVFFVLFPFLVIGACSLRMLVSGIALEWDCFWSEQIQSGGFWYSPRMTPFKLVFLTECCLVWGTKATTPRSVTPCVATR